MQGRQSYQAQMFSVFSLETLIPKGHLLRQIDEKVDFEFVREMTAPLYCQENGRPSIDPVLFVRICLLTYLYNIPSDRQVCEEIQYNLSYRWFCRLSMEDSVPDHSSLTRIRDRLGETTFKNIFDHIVRLCIEKGLVTGEKVMMDGSLIKADAALSSLEPIQSDEPSTNIVNIKDSKPSKYIKGRKFSNETHVSKTDPDCTLAGKVGEPKHLRYKNHCTIDRDSRIILDAHITTGANVDGHEMAGRLDHIEKTFSLKIDELTADRGYGYGINLDELNRRKTRSFVPNFHGDVGESINPEMFPYDKERDVFTCRNGQVLSKISTPESEKKEYAARYQVHGTKICFNCPFSNSCFTEPPKQGTRKRLVRNIFWELQLDTKQREKTRTFQIVRGERQWKMEGIFAEGKDNHGLDRARYRGRAKVQIQAYMIAVVQNIKRMMGNGPVMEVGLHQVAESYEFAFSDGIFLKLKYFLQNFARQVFA
jgi:transposase